MDNPVYFKLSWGFFWWKYIYSYKNVRLNLVAVILCPIFVHFENIHKIMDTYWLTQKLPPIYTANHATFPIRIRKITVQICGNFWVTQYLHITEYEPKRSGRRTPEGLTSWWSSSPDRRRPSPPSSSSRCRSSPASIYLPPPLSNPCSGKWPFFRVISLCFKVKHWHKFKIRIQSWSEGQKLRIRTFSQPWRLH